MGRPRQSLSTAAAPRSTRGGLVREWNDHRASNRPRGAERGPARLDAGTAVDIGAYEATSSYAVTTVSDSNNVGTLRAAVNWANLSTNANAANTGSAANTVVFDPTVFASPQTITLSLGTISLTNTSTAEVISDAPVNNVTISGGNNSGVFSVAGGVTAAISDVRIIDGSTLANGGAIDNSGNLTLTR